MWMQYLRNLNSINFSRRRHIRPNIKISKFKTKTKIFDPKDSKTHNLYYLYEGHAEVSTLQGTPIKDGANTLAFYPFWWIGEIELFLSDEDIQSSRSCVIARTHIGDNDCKCVVIELNEKVRESLDSDIVFKSAMCKHLAKKVINETYNFIAGAAVKIAEYAHDNMGDISEMKKAKTELCGRLYIPTNTFDSALKSNLKEIVEWNENDGLKVLDKDKLKAFVFDCQNC